MSRKVRGEKEDGAALEFTAKSRAFGSASSKGHLIITGVSPPSLPSPYNRSLKNPIFCSLLTDQSFWFARFDRRAKRSYAN